MWTSRQSHLQHYHGFRPNRDQQCLASNDDSDLSHFHDAIFGWRCRHQRGHGWTRCRHPGADVLGRGPELLKYLWLLLVL
jgi:hypothetical protein